MQLEKISPIILKFGPLGFEKLLKTNNSVWFVLPLSIHFLDVRKAFCV